MSVAVLPILSALADETRWRILEQLGEKDLSASALADRLPVSRQAIARHLGVLGAAGLVTSRRAGREVRYSPVGDQLSATAAQLERIGQEWDHRLASIRKIAETQ